MRVELTVLSDHRPLTVIESVHAKRIDAVRHARAIAKQKVTNNPGSSMRETPDLKFLVFDANGNTFVQVSVLN